MTAAGLEALAAEGAETLAADVTDAADRRRIADAVEPAGLVNAAGVIRLLPIDDVAEDDWDAVMAVNARALFFLTQEVGRRLGEGGAVVNVASGAGKTGSTVEAAVYSASKAAVLSMTRTFAHAWAKRGVRVNAVCPGVIETPMNDVVLDGIAAARGIDRGEVERARAAAIPMGRAAPPEEVGLGDRIPALRRLLVHDRSGRERDGRHDHVLARGQVDRPAGDVIDTSTQTKHVSYIES